MAAELIFDYNLDEFFRKYSKDGQSPPETIRQMMLRVVGAVPIEEYQLRTYRALYNLPQEHAVVIFRASSRVKATAYGHPTGVKIAAQKIRELEKVAQQKTPDQPGGRPGGLATLHF